MKRKLGLREHSRGARVPSLLNTALLSLSLTSVAMAADQPAGVNNSNSSDSDACASFLEQFHPDGSIAGAKTDPRIDSVREAHTLDEFIHVDSDGKSFATRYPFVILSAAQRLDVLIESQGSRAVLDPETGVGTVMRYSLFSDGVPAANGRRIIGQLHSIEKFVSHIKAAADGNRFGKLMTLLTGGPGTGKSEGIEIFRESLLHLTQEDPRYFNYSYEWVGLEKITAATADFPVEENGLVPAVPCQMHDSPFVLLPTVFQQAVVNQARGVVEGSTGHPLMPKKEMCPHCQHIHDTLVSHYFPNRNPSPSELFRKLSEHVRIRRVVLGTPGTAPIIDAQGRDVDLGAMFAKPNPAFLTRGPTYPLYYNINGMISSANGGPVLLDEFLKNSKENFLNPLLTAIQGGRYSYGGASLAFNVYFMGATNTADVVALQEASATHKSPILDRMVIIPFNWTIKPHETAKILSYELKGLSMQALGSGESPVESAQSQGNLDKLFPEPESPFQPAQGPDRRYNITIQHGTGHHDHQVHLSPQALMFASRVVALSRMSLDNRQLQDYFKKFGKDESYVPAPVFRDPIARINVMEGKGDIEPAQLSEFWKFSKAVREGTFGISARDASKWINETIAEARKPGNEGCVTPLLLREVLERMMTDRTIGASDAERAHIARIAWDVARRLTIPALKRDLQLAIMSSEGDSINQTYDQVMADIRAKHKDPMATSYVSSTTHRAVLINKRRYDRIKELYKQESGRELNESEISNFSVLQDRVGGPREARRNSDLMDVVAMYEVENVLAAYETKLERIVAVMSGETQPSNTEKGFIDNLVDNLRHQLGYCPVCAKQAIHLIRMQPDNQGPQTAGQ